MFGSNEILDFVARQLALGRALTAEIFVPTPGCPCVGNHIYMIEGVNLRERTIVLRNPWGYDGRGSDGADDGIVTVPINEFARSLAPGSITWVIA